MGAEAQPIGPNPCGECGGQYGSHSETCSAVRKAPAGEHLVNGEFQSDKYPTCPAGKVPLSTKDVTAQDLLWEYAQRRRAVDPEFAADLEAALKWKGFRPRLPDARAWTTRMGRHCFVELCDGNGDVIDDSFHDFEAADKVRDRHNLTLDHAAEMAEKAATLDWIEANEASVHFKNPTGFVWNVVTHNGEIDEGGATLTEALANARKTSEEIAAQP